MDREELKIRTKKFALRITMQKIMLKKISVIIR